MTREEIERRMQQLNDWQLEKTDKIHKEFTFKNFKHALDFTNEVGAIAEELQHHPDITLAWGKVRIEIYTHSSNTLSELDFNLAERIDQIV